MQELLSAKMKKKNLKKKSQKFFFGSRKDFSKFLKCRKVWKHFAPVCGKENFLSATLFLTLFDKISERPQKTK